MAIAFYIDENVPRQITVGLRLRGVDVLTVQEDKRSGLSDPLVLERSTELKRVLFTRDEDFLAIATLCYETGAYFSGIVYASQKLVSIGDLRSCTIPYKLYQVML